MRLELQEKKFKVVIDTNVIISSAISQDGASAQIFELLLLEKIDNFTAKEIINEITDVFSRPKITKLLSKNEIEFMVEKYNSFSKLIILNNCIKIVKDDPDDNKFIECAVKSNAEFIITGDSHLLNIKEFNKIKIVTPKEFILLFK